MGKITGICIWEHFAKKYPLCPQQTQIDRCKQLFKIVVPKELGQCVNLFFPFSYIFNGTVLPAISRWLPKGASIPPQCSGLSQEVVTVKFGTSFFCSVPAVQESGALPMSQAQYIKTSYLGSVYVTLRG